MDDGARGVYGFGVSSGRGGRGFELTYRWNATSRGEIGVLGTDRDIVREDEVSVVDFVISVLSELYCSSGKGGNLCETRDARAGYGQSR